MKKIYLFAAATSMFAFAACGFRINYLGASTGNASSKVDAYIQESTISKPYEVMGKGFPVAYFFDLSGRKRFERVQRKATQIAKRKGADGIIIKDTVIIANTSRYSSSTNIDPNSKTYSSNTSAAAGPVSRRLIEVLFIKYKN
jgi:hypothetical protein